MLDVFPPISRSLGARMFSPNHGNLGNRCSPRAHCPSGTSVPPVGPLAGLVGAAQSSQRPSTCADLEGPGKKSSQGRAGPEQWELVNAGSLSGPQADDAQARSLAPRVTGE